VNHAESDDPVHTIKTHSSREGSLIYRTAIVIMLVLLCVIGVTTYGVLGGKQMFQPSPPRANYDTSRLSADARTVAAALSYLLEAEPELPPDYAFGFDQFEFAKGAVARNERQLNLRNVSSTNRLSAES
jgi:hypothetical protein